MADMKFMIQNVYTTLNKQYDTNIWTVLYDEPDHVNQ